MLEFSVKNYPKEHGGFLQVSGISFMVDVTVDSIAEVDENGMMMPIGEGDRRVQSILVNGEALDPDKIYTIASTDYILLNNGDGYVIDNEGIVKVDDMTDLDVIVRYLKEYLGGVMPDKYSNLYGENRIVILK